MTQTEQVNPGESYDPLLMSPVESTSISVDEEEDQVTEGSVCLDDIIYHSECKWARQKA